MDIDTELSAIPKDLVAEQTYKKCLYEIKKIYLTYTEVGISVIVKVNPYLIRNVRGTEQR